MTLNNLDSQSISQHFQNQNYLNISSWGVPIKHNYQWIQYSLSYVKPKILIIISSMGDFAKSQRKEIFFDKSETRKVLNQNFMIPRYMTLFTLVYNLKNLSSVDNERQTRTEYASLQFDSHGGVPLDGENWINRSKRWTKRIGIDPKNIDEANYKALSQIANLAMENNIRFIFIQSPIRKKIVQQYGDQELLNQHFIRIEEIANKAPFEFYNEAYMTGMTDAYFADSTHLNHRGSHTFTERIIELVLSNNPSPNTAKALAQKNPPQSTQPEAFGQRLANAMPRPIIFMNKKTREHLKPKLQIDRRLEWFARKGHP